MPGIQRMRDYDEITSFLGVWGPFQQMVFFSLAASILPNGFTGLYIVFVGDSPLHECLIPEEANISDLWRNVAIPIVNVDGKQQHSKCTRYRLEQIQSFSDLNYTPGFEVNVSDIEQESCKDGWKYSNETYESTIITEWDIVCENEWKVPLTSSVLFLGVLVGAFVSGQLSDRFGRKPVLFGMMAIQTFFTFIQIFSPSWEVFCVMYFFVGFGGFSNYVVAFVLGSEILSKSIRVVFCSLGVFFGSAVGYMLMPVAAYFLRGWRALLVTMAASGILYVPLWWFIPESPRWLLSQGRVEEAEAILREAAKKNRITPPDIIFSPAEVENAVAKKEHTHTILDILRSCNILLITIISALLWIIITMAYYALTLNTANLHGNPYLNCFLSGIVEVPAYIAALLLLKYVPRRYCQSSTLFLGGAVTLFIQMVPADLHALAISLEMVGKFGITSAFCVVYAFTAELYPTVVRNISMGTCSMAARIGNIISPYVIYLGNYNKFLPYILIGSLAIFSGLLSFALPESFNMPLPETIDQMQRLRGMKAKNKTHSGNLKNLTEAEINITVICKEDKL